MSRRLVLFICLLCSSQIDGWLSQVFGPKVDGSFHGHVEPDQCQFKPIYKGLDLLRALNISDAMRGISAIESGGGWRLHANFDHVQVPEEESARLLPLLRHRFSAEFVYRQHRKTVATLLSINSPGKMSPWLRLTSHLKANKLYLFYRIREDGRLHEKVFDHCQHHNWSRLALSIEGTRLTMHLDCRVEKEQLAGNIFLKFPADSIIYFRQEPGFKKKLLGMVRVARISSCPIENRPWQCPAGGNSTEKRHKNLKC